MQNQYKTPNLDTKLVSKTSNFTNIDVMGYEWNPWTKPNIDPIIEQTS